MSQGLVNMYCLQEMHCSSWSGREYGKLLYFTKEQEAHKYASRFCEKHNSAAEVPEEYDTFAGVGWLWVEEASLVLVTDDPLGLYCKKLGDT